MRLLLLPLHWLPLLLPCPLQELGFEARTALQLELLPPASKRTKFAVAPQTPAAAAAAGAATSSQAPTAAPPAPPPGGFALQLKLLNGEALRGSFLPEAVLQEVAHYVDTHRTGEGTGRGMGRRHGQGRASCVGSCTIFRCASCVRMLLLEGQLAAVSLQDHASPPASNPCVMRLLPTTDGGAPYHLVQPFPRRRFSAADMQTPLAQLGFEPRQALLLEPAEPVRGGWSVGGLLATAKAWLNPYSYVTGPAGTAGGGGKAAAGAAGSGQQQGQRGGGNVHTLHDGGDAQDGSGRRDEGNSYWNGNSTEFGAGQPPGPQ